MNSQVLIVLATLFLLTGKVAAAEQETACFESRKDSSPVIQRELSPGNPNVKCSARTRGVLWWSDPFDGTVPMGDMPVEADYSHAEAVVKPREAQVDRNKLLSVCTTACHDGKYVPLPASMEPRSLDMHQDIVPDAMSLQHGRGAIWCLNCHSTTQRDKLVDNFGNLVSFNQPQKLCGKCHGQVFRDWRDGIHGKRIGMWKTKGKKRWWTCTECHNPHDVQHGTLNSGFAQLQPEPAPELPKSMKNANHEKHTEHGDTPWWKGVINAFNFNGDGDHAASDSGNSKQELGH